MVRNEYMQELISKYNYWWDVRNTYEGDELYDELTRDYDPDILDLLPDYEELRDGDAIDMTDYFSKADGLYTEFFDLMETMGLDKFKFNTRHAFGGRADYFLEVIRNKRVKLLPELDTSNEDFAIFQVV